MPKSLTPEILRQFPKTELHCHLDGSVRPETLFDLAKSQRVKMPAESVDELRDYMHVKQAANLEEYLARFAVTISVMQTEEALERIAYELAADAFREGVPRRRAGASKVIGAPCIFAGDQARRDMQDRLCKIGA